jgi:Arylsulfotransferase (ASST)/Cep192 domain 4/Secretion system C-terminal sorting domain
MRVNLYLLVFIFFAATFICSAQEVNLKKYQYISPMPNSKLNTPYTSIIIREGLVLDKTNNLNSKLEVVGSKSGLHNGEILLVENSKTILFKPYQPFAEYESVTVKLKEGIITSTATELPGLVFTFSTRDYNSQTHTIEDEYSPVDFNYDKSESENVSSPLTYPEFVVTSNNNPIQDYLLLGLSKGGTGHLLIVDNDLTPVFYKKVSGTIFDFKYQPTGELTYNIYSVNSYGMDNSGIPTKQYITPEGFALDIHELQVLEDSSYYLLGREHLTIDMSQFVANGDTAAILIAHTIHHMDANDNEIWRWRSFDHYDITDVDDFIDLTQHQIDWTHANSIEIDRDGNILLSTRNFSEITKINRQTGDIIWRFGGEKNQFQIQNDNRGFSRQHDVRRFSNGNLAFFDNGKYLIPEYSSYVEYILDEQGLIARLRRRYSRDQTVFTASRGGVQELSNGHTLISWGENQNPSITEINSKESIEFEIMFTSYAHQYRAYRLNWKTNLFLIDVDSMDFGLVEVGDSSIKLIELRNPKDEEVSINEIFSRNSVFSFVDSLPLVIPPHKSIKLSILFKPDTNGYFVDKLNIRSVNDTLLIGQQVVLRGSSDVVTAEDTKQTVLSYSLSQNFPNPFNPETTISFSLPQRERVIMKIYNILGEEIFEFINGEFDAGNYSFKLQSNGLPSGIYLYRMNAGEFVRTRKFILLK